MEMWFKAVHDELTTCAFGTKGAVIAKYAQALGMSEKTLYRKISAYENTGRKKRSDAGSSAMSTDNLKLMASMMLNSVRGNGKQTMDIPTAKQILMTNGIDIPVSNSRLSLLLRENGLNVGVMKQDSSCVRMRSLHPNHVHQVDPSLCLLYYAPDGSQHIIRDEEAYKNKPFMQGKEKMKLWRYVMVDHYSGSICHRYYETAGENVLTLWQFLLYAWGEKENNAFHGLPEIMVWDKGSANTSKAIANACKSLRIKTIPHTAENPRAKGSVECANNMIEKLFESRLKLQPVSSVEELNKYAEQWDARYNANMIPNYNSELTRCGHRFVRTKLWQSIKKNELIELPKDANELLVHSQETRQVKSDLTISYSHPRLSGSASYGVSCLPGVYPKMEITVQPVLVSNDGKILVSYQYNDQLIEEELLPFEVDEAGFRLTAPVFGVSFKANAQTLQEQKKKALEDLIGDKKRPFIEVAEGKGLQALDAISDGDNVHFFSRTGSQMEKPKAIERKLSIVEAMLQLKVRLGYVDATTRAYLNENYPSGVPESELTQIADRIEEDNRKAECS